ncbi:Integrase catalytic core [Arabidopsis suecica]|uniref:Integrase catalytic core n=1 Tax=Arabidopsis suecica TaxID=45249 RepID=A0A8T2BA08_ARASU|nr:Integrase catalytic core [Arabidopsis suecica]
MANPHEIVNTNQSLLNVNMSNITKLTAINYMTWSLQVHSLLDGYDLAGYVDGSSLPPDQTLTVNARATPNPAYTLWRRQDKLVYSGLFGTLSPSVQPLVAKTKSAAEMWSKIADTYAKPSWGHIQQLRLQLKHQTKGEKTIDDYMQGLTTRFDQLALLGKPLEHEEQIEFIFQGLPEEYKSVVDQVEGRDTPPSITEVHEKLINKEAKLLATSLSASSVAPISANVATSRQNQYQGKSSYRQNKPWNSNNQSNYQQQKQDNRGTRGYQGKCQLCGVFGHSAKRCSQLQQHHNGPQNSLLPTPFRPWQPRANLALTSPHPANAWLMDSGATHHMTSDLNNLAMHQPYSGDDSVLIGDGSGLSITHTGSLSLPSTSRNLTLNSVLCVPNIQKNLISVYRLCNANKVSVEFFPAHFQVKDLSSGVPLIQGKTKDELYEWPASPSTLSSFFASTSPKTTLTDWHYRLGHPSFSILKSVISSYSLPCIQSNSVSSLCSDCAINKTHKLPFSQSSIHSTRPLEYVFTDVWSSPVTSIDNYKYYLVLVDHYSRYTWLYPLKLKSQVRETFVAFKALVENRLNTKIGTLFSDNGGEFIALRSLLSSAGISHLTSPPHTPEHNGISERKHRHVVETGLTMLTHASMPKHYWSYAFTTATYLINRLPTPNLSMESPYQKLFGETPNYTKLRVFGCLCFPWLRPYTFNKLEDRSTPCVFLGYSQTQSAYLCLQPSSGRIYVSRHVKFDETRFPFQRPSSHPTPSLTPPSQILSNLPSLQNSVTIVPMSSPAPAINTGTTQPPAPPLISSPLTGSPCSDSHHPVHSTPPSSQTVSSTENSISETIASSNQSHSSSPSLAHQQNSPLPSPNTNEAQSPNVSQSETQTQNHSVASQNQPATSSTTQHNSNPIANPEPVVGNIHPMQTRGKNQITKPTKKYTLSAALSTPIPPEPQTVNQALKDHKWRGAMSDEINAFARNRTFDLVPRQPHYNIVGCKWIFKNKFLPNGSLNRCKARLVAKGYNQQFGRDYTDTFSPVIKSTTLRLVLDVAVTRGWPIQQLDVNNAFLQGTLTEEVYMDQPPRFVDSDNPTHVCRLRKAIYGLKQAPRAWYNELRTFLLSLGFANSVSDTSLFVLQQGSSFVYLLVYVDDILVTGSSKSGIQRILTLLADRFSVKDAEDLNYFLGLEAHRTSKGLHLSQRKYILDLLHRYNMINAKAVTTPMATSPKLTLTTGTPMSDPSEFRKLVGSLQYLSFTRLDIAYAVNRLSQFMHQPTDDHWQAAKRILRYLAGTTTHGIFFSATNNLSLHAFSDADWAGDTNDCVSTNAYIVYLGSNPISWMAKKQNGVARSSTEAEYRSVANTAAEISWICNILTELGIKLPAPPVVYCDNVGATFLCANPVFHSRMKHIAIDYHFVRGQVQNGALRVSHVNTKDQLADALTKPLSRARFIELRNKIGVVSTPPS